MREKTCIVDALERKDGGLDFQVPAIENGWLR